MRTCVVLLIWVLLASLGCVHSSVQSVGTRTYPPRAKDWPIDVYHGANADREIVESIEISKDEATVPRGSQTVGRMSCRGAPAASWGSILESAQKQARGLGGDGIVIHSAFVSIGREKTLDLSVVRYKAEGALVASSVTPSKAPSAYEEPYEDPQDVATLATTGETYASGSPCPMILVVQSIDGAPVRQALRGSVKLLPGAHKVELGCSSSDSGARCSLSQPYAKDIVVAAGRTYYFRGVVNGTFSRTRTSKALTGDELAKLIGDVSSKDPAVSAAARARLQSSQNVALEMKDGRFFTPVALASVSLVVGMAR